MKIDYVSIVVLAFLPLVLRTLLYLIALRIRSIRITFLRCVVVAGAPTLVGIFGAFIPQIVAFGMSILLACYLLTRYTEAEVYPDGLFIPLAVEVVLALCLAYVIVPLLR
jgi:hypothetical protein